MIKYLVMDVDGTLTNGKIYISPMGECMKAFNVKDGCGIHELLIPQKIIPIIITGRMSDIVNYRCKELGITEVYQGVKNKLNKLCSIIDDLSVVAYIGDDINDLECMEAVKGAGGFVGCPSDAYKSVKEVADFVSLYKGGEGAVRDYIEWLIMRNCND